VCGVCGLLLLFWSRYRDLKDDDPRAAISSGHMRLLLEAIVEKGMLPLADTNANDVQTLAEYLEFAPFQAGERVIQK
jgi:hypothetical protein